MNQTMKPFLAVKPRWMIEQDYPEVMGIERACFESPWQEEDLRRCLRSFSCIGQVAEKGSLITGFMIYELNRRSYRLLNFAVAPHFQRHGVGTQLLAHLKGKVIRGSGTRCRINVLVREDDLRAQLFFKANGFRWIRSRSLGGVSCYHMRWVRPE